MAPTTFAYATTYPSTSLAMWFGTGERADESEESIALRMQASWASVAAGSPSVEPIGVWPPMGNVNKGGGTWVIHNVDVQAQVGWRRTACDLLDRY